jgi:cytochrome d ubiquinol oxidase subunit II
MIPDLNTIWFVLVGVLFTGYALLDGFDLGVGALHLFAKREEDRRVTLNAIGPVWDGNEVWLVAGGGALFAAFPHVYATIFSGFYLALVLLLLMLIFRAVAIEFRSRQPMAWWRKSWDISFSVASIAASLLLGVALGNIALGVPLHPDHEYAGTFLGLLNPFALIVGVTTVSLFMMHGAIFLALKSEGEFHLQVRRWVKNTVIVFSICYVATSLAMLLFVPHMVSAFKTHPYLLGLPILNALAIANVPREIHHGRDFRAFLSSCAALAALMALFGLGMYPDIVMASNNAAYSLTIYNAASSQKTLTIMLVIATIGVPLVLTYTASIYWVFRGKVKLDKFSY